MDAAVLELHKENIQPLASGRPALKLGAALTEPRGPAQREAFEARLASDESDDPLQDYVDYIAWTHNHYPQGGNAESGLLALLERCTSCFRDTPYYKNDPRYLKVWLEYAAYSDLPRDVFVYLAKKDIALQLALYYEEFAKFLEARGLIADAREVYEIGLERGARPAARLARTFHHFRTRTALAGASAPSQMRGLLSAKRLASSVVEGPSKQPKILVQTDLRPPSMREAVFSKDLAVAPVPLRAKENVMSAKPWAGEVYKQHGEAEKAMPKFQVFKDAELPAQDTGVPSSEYEVVHENGEHVTIVSQPGKPRERLNFNMRLVRPSDDEEYCFAEIYALASKLTRPERVVEQNHTFTIPLRDDDTSQHPNSPTMTMFSRQTVNEVYGMFNKAASSFQLDDESTKAFEESTNYDGFVTETVELNAQTPPTDHYDSDAGSSPFLERPS